MSVCVYVHECVCASRSLCLCLDAHVQQSNKACLCLKACMGASMQVYCLHACLNPTYVCDWAHMYAPCMSEFVYVCKQISVPACLPACIHTLAAS